MLKIPKMPKYLAAFIMLSFLFMTGCDSDSGGGFLQCTNEEIRERFTTDCIAEEFVTGCENIGCNNRRSVGMGEKEISIISNSDCTVIDCETMECDLRVSGEENQLGLAAELSVDEETGFPTGVFILEDQESTFECLTFSP